MKARQPFRLECFYGEDVNLTGTITNITSLAGVTLKFIGWDSAGTVKWNSTGAVGGATVAVVSASECTYSAAVNATFTPGTYKWAIYRTNSGYNYVLLWGYLAIDNIAKESEGL